MVILDLITHLFPTGSGASTLHVARGDGNNFTGRHFPLVGLGLGLACFIAAAVKPIDATGSEIPGRGVRVVWVLLSLGLGVVMLIIAVYFGVTRGW
jgi:hypothetical protein